MVEPKHYRFTGSSMQRVLVRAAGVFLVAFGLDVATGAILEMGYGSRTAAQPGQQGVGGAVAIFFLWVAYRTVKTGIGVVRLRRKEWKTAIVIASIATALFVGAFSVVVALAISSGTDRPYIVYTAVEAILSLCALQLLIGYRRDFPGDVQIGAAANATERSTTAEVPAIVPPPSLLGIGADRDLVPGPRFSDHPRVRSGHRPDRGDDTVSTVDREPPLGAR